MATQTVTTSGSNTVYTIKDVANNTATITAIQTPGYTTQVSYAGGPLLPDGVAFTATLLQLLATGVTPNQNIPAP